jgi:tetratricopeptide (TPR) repeat protein
VVVSAVAGLAGVGKTALAVRAGNDAREAGWFPGGVLFIDLHGYDPSPVQPGQALDALLRALGIADEHVPEGTEQRAALYRSTLDLVAGPVLVIVDNASSEAQVRPLLPGPGPHRVIITSRHTLAALGARLLDVTILSQAAAVQLLDAVVKAARPDDARVSGDMAAAEQLALACGKLPLALQITAALLVADPALTATELAEEMADEVRRLETLQYDDGSGAGVPSVTAAFELSYRQLDDDAARLFRLLPADPGPDLSTGAAAALTGWPTSRARAVLGRLARAHLVEAGGMQGRWQMHDLLRLYALQVPESLDGERAQAIGQLFTYYSTCTSAAEAHLRAVKNEPVTTAFTSRDDALVWLDAQRPNLIAAITMAASIGQEQIAVNLTLALSQYLDRRRRFDDLIATLTAGLDCARRQGDPAGEAAVLAHLGLALQEVRQFERAIDASQAAASIFREIGDRQGQGLALGNLGLALADVERFEEAVSAHQEALTICRETGDRHGEGQMLGNLGSALTELRRFGEAISAQQEAVAIFQETDDTYGEGIAQDNLGLALAHVGRFNEAVTAHQNAALKIRQTGDRHREGMALNNLGIALQRIDKFDDAIGAHEAAVVIFQESSDPYRKGLALGALGMALTSARRFQDGVSAHQAEVAIFREIRDPHAESRALSNLGLALGAAQRLEEAVNAYKDAAASARETGDRRREGSMLSNLGLVLVEAQRLEEAVNAYKDAVGIFQEAGDRRGEGRALDYLASAYRKMQLPDRAAATWREATAAARDAGDPEEAARLDQHAADC